jgi:prepilin-type N-terminal cleavage/methylation domain-containing protein
MFKKHSRRSGFTLPEVLVTVAIVAVLAAMVVPAVTQQIGKADVPTFQTSMGSLRTAITSFVSDVKAFPGQVDHLQTDIATTDYTLSILGAGVGAPLYTQSQVDKWKGPYDNSGSATGAITLGMDWQTTNVLMDSLGYLVVEITKTNADSTDAALLDIAIDGTNSKTTGLVRWELGTGAALDPANKIRLFLMSSAR